MDYSPPGSSVPGISQAKLIELTFLSPGDLPNPGIEPMSPALAGRLFTLSTWETHKVLYLEEKLGKFYFQITCNLRLSHL